MNPESDKDRMHWYAVRIHSGVSLIEKRISLDGVRSYRTRFAGNIVFLRCTAAYASLLIGDYWGRIFFYLDSKHGAPEAIDDKEMNNFMLVTGASDDLIPLGEVTREFLSGERVRVTAGVFKGAEGVIKRIKGDRRLVVSINCCTAVATCHIRPEFLEKV